MKSLRSTLILLVVVAALGGYIWFNERGPIAESGATVLLRSDPNTVERVAMQWHGASVELRKNGSRWMAEQPKKAISVPADADAVKTLLNDLQLLQTASVLPDEAAKRKNFGLEKPGSSLGIGGAKIEFGASPSFDSTKVYARITNDGKTQIALLPSSLGTAVAKSFNDWRDKAALRVTLDEAQKITIKAPAISATFEKTKSGEDGKSSEWKITSPVAAEADSSTIEGLIGQLPITKATRFLDDKPQSLAKWQLDKPQAQVEFSTPDGPRSLSLGKSLAAGHAAKNSLSAAVFEVPNSLFGLLNRPLRDWRAKTVVKLDVDNVAEVEIAARGGKKRFAKTDEKWREAGAKVGTTAKEQEAADAAHRAVMDILLVLQALSATGFVDKPAAPANYGFDKPLLDLVIDGTTHLQIGTSGGKFYARTGSGANFAGSVFVLPKSAFDALKSPLDTLFGVKK